MRSAVVVPGLNSRRYVEFELFPTKRSPVLSAVTVATPGPPRLNRPFKCNGLGVVEPAGTSKTSLAPVPRLASPTYKLPAASSAKPPRLLKSGDVIELVGVVEPPVYTYTA